MAACTEIERIVDPSPIHVFDSDDVTYNSSPPTSGPHQVPGPEPGVAATPIPEAQQVAALETGTVLIQYATDVAAADVAELEALAQNDGVLVAPGARAFDDDATIAFTAWGVRQLCSELDIDAAEAFIEARVGVFFVDH